MTWYQSIPKVAISLIFVISTIVALIGAGKVVDSGISYFLNTTMTVCEPYYPAEVKKIPPVLMKSEPCHPDIRFLKERLAEGLSLLLTAGPIAFFLWRKIKKEL